MRLPPMPPRGDHCLAARPRMRRDRPSLFHALGPQSKTYCGRQTTLLAVMNSLPEIMWDLHVVPRILHFPLCLPSSSESLGRSRKQEGGKKEKKRISWKTGSWGARNSARAPTSARLGKSLQIQLEGAGGATWLLKSDEWRVQRVQKALSTADASSTYIFEAWRVSALLPTALWAGGDAVILARSKTSQDVQLPSAADGYRAQWLDPWSAPTDLQRAPGSAQSWTLSSRAMKEDRWDQRQCCRGSVEGVPVTVDAKLGTKHGQ